MPLRALEVTCDRLYQAVGEPGEGPAGGQRDRGRAGSPGQGHQEGQEDQRRVEELGWSLRSLRVQAGNPLMSEERKQLGTLPAQGHPLHDSLFDVLKLPTHGGVHYARIA